jgi:predicted nucleic acid-binding protein
MTRVMVCAYHNDMAEMTIRSTYALDAETVRSRGRRRRIFLDCLIAAAALRGHGELATSNPDDFEAFAERGLSIARPD